MPEAIKSLMDEKNFHNWELNGAKRSSGVETATVRLRILWIVNLDYELGINHGGNLRFINLSRELRAKGHKSVFLVSTNKLEDADKKREYLDNLKATEVIDDYFEIDYFHPKFRGKLAHITFDPLLANKILRKGQAPVVATIRRVITDEEINICIFADRRMLFALPSIGSTTATIIDWVDSAVLYRIRELRLCLKTRQFKSIPSVTKHLVDAYVEEKFYGRRCAVNTVVSPIDKNCLDNVNRLPDNNRVLSNGITVLKQAIVIEKVKNRLIFSGNMDFPPNFQSAIWFIDNVMPLLRKCNEMDIRLIIAGASPVEELRMRAAPDIEITGFVQDMRTEIAKSSLYVAPLVSGGGFKNKIVEAIASGTFVVATTMAVEFLDKDLQDKFLVADDAKQFGEKVLTFLRDPTKFDQRLTELIAIINRDFTWSHRADEFIQTAYKVAGQFHEFERVRMPSNLIDNEPAT